MNETETGTTGVNPLPERRPAGDRPQSILDNPQVYNLLMRAIDERVAARIQESRNSSQRRLIGYLAIAVTLIVATAGGLFEAFLRSAARGAVDAAVVEEVRISVNEAVNDALNSALFESRVAALNFRVLSLDIEESFGADTATSIVDEVRSLYSRSPDDVARARLSFAVETAAESFAAADSLDLVNQLEDAAPELVQRSDVVIQARVQLTGRRLLAAAGAPRTWLDEQGSLGPTYRDYREHAEDARRAGYPELRLAFELPLRHLEGRPLEEITALIDDVNSLNDGDTARFVQVMASMAESALRDPGTDLDAESRRVVERVTRFLCEHRARSLILDAASIQAGIECP